jgi:hypothetical protein
MLNYFRFLNCRGHQMKYTTGSIVNLLTLVLGIIIGITLAPKLERNVSAQKTKVVNSCVSEAGVECVTPIMTVGSAGIGKLLVNQIAADQLTVNGYDLLKLNNNMLNALVENRIISIAQAQALVSISHPDKQLRFASSVATPPKAK